MAKFTSTAAVDVRAISMYQVAGRMGGGAFWDNELHPFTGNGVSFADQLYIGSQYVSGVGTRYLYLASTSALNYSSEAANPLQENAVTGTVNYFSWRGGSGETSKEYFSISGVAFAAADLLNVVKTESADDDRSFIAGLFLGDDSFTLSSGADYVAGGGGKDTMTGNGGADSLYGGSGADKIFGGTSADLLYGDSGADSIQGGTGADSLYGGTSGDDFVFNDGETGKGAGRDVIFDFVAGSDDLDLKQIDAKVSSASTDQKFAFSGTTAADYSVWYKVSGKDVIVYGDNTGDGKADFEIELRGVHSLSASDFIL